MAPSSGEFVAATEGVGFFIRQAAGLGVVVAAQFVSQQEAGIGGARSSLNLGARLAARIGDMVDHPEDAARLHQRAQAFHHRLHQRLRQIVGDIPGQHGIELLPLVGQAVAQETNCVDRSLSVGSGNQQHRIVGGVEHIMRIVMSLASRVVVLDQGRKIAEGPPAEIQRGWPTRSLDARTCGSTMPLVDDPNETIVHDVDRCGGCGADLTGAQISRVERRQVTDIAERSAQVFWVVEQAAPIGRCTTSPMQSQVMTA